MIDLPEEVCKRLLLQSNKLTLKEIFNVFNCLIGALDASRKLFAFKLPLEIALVKLSQGEEKIEKEIPPNDKSVKQAKPEIKPHKIVDKKEEHSKKEAVAQEQEIIDARNLIEIDKVKEIWPNILEKVSQIKIYIKHCLENSAPLKVRNNVLTLGFGQQFNFYKEALETKDNRALVERIISELSGQNIRLNFELVENHVLNLEAPAALIENDEELGSALRFFKGRVVDA